MFVNIGLGALVRSEDVLVVADPWRDPIRRCIDLAEREGRLVDASGNKRRRSAIIMRDGTVVLSMYSCESMARRLNGKVTEEQRG